MLWLGRVALDLQNLEHLLRGHFIDLLHAAVLEKSCDEADGLWMPVKEDKEVVVLDLRELALAGEAVLVLDIDLVLPLEAQEVL